MKKKMTLTESLTISSMLFGLFFGAGNLIFPAYLGQAAGRHVWLALLGFLITGVGMPLLAIAALGITKSTGLFDLSSRVGKKFALFFTCLLYLSIGPFFAIPRCFTVPFETGISSLLPGTFNKQLGLFLFTLIFFALMLFFSLRPGRIMDWIGKFLTPMFLIVFFTIMITALLHPTGSASGKALGAYAKSPLLTGVLAGYNTLDVLAGLAFGIIVVSSIQAFGVTEPDQIAKETVKTGILTSILMAIIYGITSLAGATSRPLGIADNGGTILANIAHHYFPGFGAILFALMIFIACLKTAIGLITACAETFNGLFPKYSYNKWAIFFSVFALAVANIGLDAIISISTPFLMLLYPLAISLIIMALTGNFCHFEKSDCQIITAVTFICALGDFFKALPSQPAFLVKIYSNLPLYKDGLGWLVPFLIAYVILAIRRLIKSNKSK